MNHRGWIVLTSVESDDRAFCVDVFEAPAGSYGFEHFRADPEDGGTWTAVGGFSAQRYDAPGAALEAALVAVRWLTSHPQARVIVEQQLADFDRAPIKEP